MGNLRNRFGFIILFVFIPFFLTGKELLIGVGLFEPFFIEKNESGIFLDLTKEVFKLLPEYEVKFIFMSNKRLLKEINAGRVDAACNIFKASEVKAHLSNPFFKFIDVAVTLKKKKFKIETVSDLAGKSIAAYQGATDLLGDEFRKMALANSKYHENSEQYVSTNLLLKGRVDVRIGDVFIFLYDIKRPYNWGKVTAEDFTIHYLWPEVYSHFAFKDEKIRDKVNLAIKEIIKNGTYEAVYKKYERYLKGDVKEGVINGTLTK